MQIKTKTYPLIVGLIITFFLFAPVETIAQAAQSSFSVTPNYPSQQANDVTGYYDLTVKKEKRSRYIFLLETPPIKTSLSLIQLVQLQQIKMGKLFTDLLKRHFPLRLNTT
ncbi:hypothetical protein A5881_002389 [Enterococcus termitis]